jgi:hypothetical protein
MKEKYEKLCQPLTVDDVEVRVGNVMKDKNTYSLLLYKTSRVDQNRLDSAVGHGGWKREHKNDSKGNVICILSIYDEDKKEWIHKEDVGTPSNTEAIKGAYSDSFKRACFNWGIGRELYQSPSLLFTGLPPKSWEIKLLEYNVINSAIKSVKIEINGKAYLKINTDIAYLPEENSIFKELKDKLTKCKTEEYLEIVRHNIKNCGDKEEISEDEKKELRQLYTEVKNKINDAAKAEIKNKV